MEENMPKCPECNSNEYVLAVTSSGGSYFCNFLGCDGGWFTPCEMTESKAKPAPVQYRTLSPDFLKLMDEIGIYGLEKYGDQSMEAKFKRGDFSRFERTKAREIIRHAQVHGDEYLDGVLHDKFDTSDHQLAAAAFNMMMEFRLRNKK